MLSVKSFFKKIERKSRKIGLSIRHGLVYLLLPLLASGVNERDLFKSDVKKLMKYFKMYLDENPDRRVRGLSLALNNYNNSTKTLQTYINFVEWLQKKDPKFIKEYMGGEIQNQYDQIKRDRKAFIETVHKYGAKYVQSEQLLKL